MSDLIGQRLPDLDFRENFTMRQDPPGTFRKIVNTPPDYAGETNLTGEVWFVITPNGLHGNLANHTVREHEDGMITVAPGDGSSNSILVSGGGDGLAWHGYIDHGRWYEV